MKNLSFKIDTAKKTVTFSFYQHSSTSDLVEGFDYQKLVDRCVTVEQDERITNSGNDLFKTKTLIFRDKNQLPLINIPFSNMPLTKEMISEIENEYQEAVSEARTDAKNWRELYTKTTGFTAPKGTL